MTHDDPKLTAYALNELDDVADRARVEAFLAQDETARRIVEETRQTAATYPSTSPDPATALERSESTAEVLRMLERLPENQKEAITLKFGHGLSYKEIAEITGLTVSNVGFLIHTGLKTVRQRLLPV